MTPAKKKAPAKKKTTAKARVTTKRSASPKRGPLTWAAVVAMAKRFPLVTAEETHGTPGLKVRGHFLCRLKDAETIVLKTGSILERDYLMQNEPKVFFITAHYQNYPAVLVRLAAAKPDVIAGLIEDGWRRNAGKRALAAHDAK